MGGHLQVPGGLTPGLQVSVQRQPDDAKGALVVQVGGHPQEGPGSRPGEENPDSDADVLQQSDPLGDQHLSFRFRFFRKQSFSETESRMRTTRKMKKQAKLYKVTKF